MLRGYRTRGTPFARALLVPPLRRVVPLVAAVAGALALAACSSDQGGGVDWGDPGNPASAPDGGSGNGDGDAATLGDAGGATQDAGGTGACPVLVYPSGVKIQTFRDAATTASYAHHLAPGESAPTCFLDADNLLDPDTGEVQTLKLNVSANFQLEELVGTEIDQGYGHFVLAAPAAVAALQKFRDDVATSVDVISGFRSPAHQEAVCKSLCGNPLGCPGTCANNSRHMFGDAFDLPLAFYTSRDEQLACDAGFKFAYLESGTHLHVDQNPDYKTCVKQ